MQDRGWEKLVAKQRGAFSLAQARASGRNSSMLTRAVKAGHVRRGLPGVYLVVGTPRTRSQRAHEALLWAGPDAALSHETAGSVLGLDIATDQQIHVTTARNLRPPDASIRVHRRALPARDVTRRHDLRTTTMPRTIIDLAGTLIEEALDIAVDSAIRLGMARSTFLERFADVAAGRQPGTAALRRLISERETEQGLTGSAFERRLLRLIRREKLPLPVCQFPVVASDVTAYIDFAYPEFGIAVEADGYRWHDGRAAFENDRRRASELASLGWRVLQITWLQVKYEPAAVAARIDRALRTPAISALRS